MPCRDGADVFGAVGGGRGDGDANGSQKALGTLVRRDADRQRIQPAGDLFTDRAAAAVYERQRPGQKGLAQFFCIRLVVIDELVQIVPAVHVHDERVVLRAALDGVDVGDGGVRTRVGAQAVDRFGREGDAFPLQQVFFGGEQRALADLFDAGLKHHSSLGKASIASSYVSNGGAPSSSGAGASSSFAPCRPSCGSSGKNPGGGLT